MLFLLFLFCFQRPCVPLFKCTICKLLSLGIFCSLHLYLFSFFCVLSSFVFANPPRLLVRCHFSVHQKHKRLACFCAEITSAQIATRTRTHTPTSTPSTVSLSMHLLPLLLRLTLHASHHNISFHIVPSSPMSIRLTLQYNKTPSHAVITCTPWTRLLVETESPSGKGHVIGAQIALRKTTGFLNIITRIEVKQLKGDTTKAQLYVDAADWWLHRAPFSVERLPVKLVAYNYLKSLVSVDGWNVTSLTVIGDDREGAYPCLNPLGALAANLKDVYVRHTTVYDFSPFRNVETLAACFHCEVRDISGLAGCQNLRRLRVPTTYVKDLNALAGVLSLEEVNCNCTSVSTLAPLATCHNLKKVNAGVCGSLDDLSPLSDLVWLEEVDCSTTRVSTLAPLAICRNLKKVSFRWCGKILDISPLASAPLFEEIDCSYTNVATLAPLAMCRNLKTVNVAFCSSIFDLSPLAGLPCLQEIQAKYSSVTTITGLGTCLQLKTVNFVGCRALHDLSPLENAPSLKTVRCNWSDISVGTALQTRPDLVTDLTESDHEDARDPYYRRDEDDSVQGSDEVDYDSDYDYDSDSDSDDDDISDEDCDE